MLNLVQAVLCFIALLHGVMSQDGSNFNDDPKNAAYNAGYKDATLVSCGDKGNKESVKWAFQVDKDTQLDISTLDGKIDPNYDRAEFVKLEENTRNLLFNRSDGVQRTDAGQYRCEGKYTERNKTRWVELLVVDKFTCRIEDAKADNIWVEKETLYTTCEVYYGGKWPPRLRWNFDGVVDGVVDNTINGTVKTVRTLKKLVLKPEHNGKSLDCILDYAGPDVTDPTRSGVTPAFPYGDPCMDNGCNCSVKLPEVQYTARNIMVDGYEKDEKYKDGHKFNCSAIGNPEPAIRWVDSHGDNVKSPIESQLTVSSDMKGRNTYMCIANNTVGSLNYNITFSITFNTPHGKDGEWLGILYGISAGIGTTIIITVALVFLIRRWRIRRSNHAKPMKKWIAPTSSLNEQPSPGTCCRLSGSHAHFSSGSNCYTDDPTYVSHNSTFPGISNPLFSTLDEKLSLESDSPLYSYEIQRGNVYLEKVLGEGHFGVVYKANVAGLNESQKSTVAAVKSIKPHATEKDKQDLYNEMEVMATLPHHDNVVELLACCTFDDPIYLILEYMSTGSLKDFLRVQRNTQVSVNSLPASHRIRSYTDTSERSSQKLITFALQVSMGMEHISNHQLLHRDLAARNVLLDANQVCKISDFGLARDIIDRNEYQRESSGPLPVRWMAPESIWDNVYTTKSDVWSFGVLLWEIVTLGASPYPGMGPKQVMTGIQKGFRMEKPEHCAEKIYNIMQQCWNSSPDERPSFTDNIHALGAMLVKEESGSCIQLALYQDDLYQTLDPSEEEKV